MPTLTVKDKEIEMNDNGYIVNVQDWTSDVAEEIAKSESLPLTDKHWDVLNYLRDEFLNNNENQPNTRNIVKAMQAKWNNKGVSAKDLYDLFPKDPSKQAGRIAGLPESRRKGGY